MQYKKYKNVSKKLKLRVKKKTKRDLKRVKKFNKDFYHILKNKKYKQYDLYYTKNGKVVELNAKR